jgi:hypothetical protein
VLLDPATVAVIVLDCPPVSEAEVGDTEMVTTEAFRETTALAVLELSATLVAFTVTDCAVVTVDGALYTPLVTEPTAGDTLQVTPVLLVPLTAGVKVAV